MKVHTEVQAMFDYMCTPAELGQIIIPSPWEQTPGDVNLPACAHFAEHTRLYGYYGNVNMLMVEAWRGKVELPCGPSLHCLVGCALGLSVQSAVASTSSHGANRDMIPLWYSLTACFFGVLSRSCRR